jgi:hypothetical protein
MSRSTTAKASATNRDRVHALELFAGETCPVAVDFTAILGAAAALSSATWTTDNNTVAVMADAVIDGNTSQITLTAGSPGAAMLRCVGGTDSGTRFVQLFVLTVTADATFAGSSTSGPTSLEATAVVAGVGSSGGQILDGGGA